MAIRCPHILDEKNREAFNRVLERVGGKALRLEDVRHRSTYVEALSQAERNAYNRAHALWDATRGDLSTINHRLDMMERVRERLDDQSAKTPPAEDALSALGKSAERGDTNQSAAPQFTEAMKADLTSRLKRMLPPGYEVQFSHKLFSAMGVEQDGRFNPERRLVELATARGPEKALAVGAHEIVHGLRKLGAFTDEEWQTLVERANKTQGDDAYSGHPSIKPEQRYLAMFEQRARDNKLAPEEAKQFVARMMEEERVAHLVERHFSPRQAKYGAVIDALMKRMHDILNAIVETFRGHGLNDLGSIGRRMETGAIAKRVAPKTRSEKPYRGPSLTEREDARAVADIFEMSALSGERSDDVDKLGYYSQLDRVLKSFKPTDTVTAATLAKRGVKMSEIEMRGLGELLGAGKGARVGELATIAGQNPVLLNRAFYAGPNELEKLSSNEVDRYVPRWMQTIGAGIDLLPWQIADNLRDVIAPGFESLVQRRLVRDTPVGRAGPPRWSAHSLDPNNPTYGETVVHLPSGTSKNERAVAMWGKPYAELDQVRRIAVDREVDFGAITIGAVSTNPDVRTSHFPEPNIVGHFQHSIDINPSDGKPVFNLNQVQSDWGQKLRVRGVRDEAKIAELKRQIMEHNNNSLARAARVVKPGGANYAAQRLMLLRVLDQPGGREWLDTKHRLDAELQTAEASVPGHPLVKTTDQWTNTVLRHAVQMAVDADTDHIAVPSGKTVLSYNPGDEDNEHGMEEFYDKIVPKNLAKILQKLDPDTKGSRIETLRTPNKPAAGHGFTIFPLTEIAKERLRAEGQQMFALGGGGEERPTGPTTRPFQMPGIDKAAVTTSQREDGLRNRFYVISDADGKPQMKLALAEREPDLWAAVGLSIVDPRLHGKGKALELIKSVEEDLGGRLLPDGIVARETYERVRLLEPERVRFHALGGPEFDGLYLPPKAVTMMREAVSRAAEGSEDPAVHKMRDALRALEQNIPDEHFAAERLSKDMADVVARPKKPMLSWASLHPDRPPPVKVEPPRVAPANAARKPHALSGETAMMLGLPEGARVITNLDHIAAKRGAKDTDVPPSLATPEAVGRTVGALLTSADYAIPYHQGNQWTLVGRVEGQAYMMGMRMDPNRAGDYEVKTVFPVTTADLARKLKGALGERPMLDDVKRRRNSVSVGSLLDDLLQAHRQSRDPYINRFIKEVRVEQARLRDQAKNSELSAFSSGPYSGAPQPTHLPNLGDTSRTDLNVPDAGLSDLTKMLNEALGGGEVRQGRLNPGLKAAMGRLGMKLYGQFDKRTGITRIAIPNDMETLAHEGGHNLEIHPELKTYIEGIKRANYAELVPLASPGPNVLSEGWSEFFRRFVVDPTDAEKVAPNTLRAFKNMLEAQHPEMLIALEAVQKGYQEAINASPAGAVFSRVQSLKREHVGVLRQGYRDVHDLGITGAAAKWGGTVDQWLYAGTRDLLDEAHPFNAVVKLAVKQHTAEYNKNLDDTIKALTPVADTPGSVEQMARAMQFVGVAEPYVDAMRAEFDGRTDVSKTDVIAHLNGKRLRPRNWLRGDPGNELTIKAAYDPYKLASLAKLVQMQSTSKLRFGVVPFGKADPQGASVQDALAAAFGGREKQQWNEDSYNWFNSYLVARRINAEWDRHDMGDLPGIPDSLIGRDVWSQAENDIVQAYPNFAKGAKLLDEFMANQLKWKFDNGFLTQELYDELRSRDGYAPVNRIMDHEVEGVEQGSKTTAPKRVIKRFLGSTRNYIAPVESIIRDVYLFQKIAARNDVGNALLDIAQSLGPNGGRIAEVIPAKDMRRLNIDTTGQMEMLRKITHDRIEAIRASGDIKDSEAQAYLDEMDIFFDENGAMTMFQPVDTRSKGGHEKIIWLYRKGERVPVMLGTDKLAGDMFNFFGSSGSPTDLGPILNIFVAGKRTFMAGITKSPAYIAGRYFRDEIDVWLKSRDYTPFVSGSRGIARLIKQDDASKRYQYHMGMSGVDTMTLDDLTHGRDALALRKSSFLSGDNSVKGWWQNVLRAPEMIGAGAFLENTERQFQRLKGEGFSEDEAIKEASYNALDVLPYSRRGSRMNASLQVFALLNARIQAISSMTRTMIGGRDAHENYQKALTPYLKSAKGEPLSVAEREMLPNSVRVYLGMITLGMLALSLRFMYRGDPDYEEFSKSEMGDTHYFVKIFGQPFRFPKDYEGGLIADAMEDTWDRYYQKDPTAAARFARAIRNTVLTEPDFEYAKNIQVMWNEFKAHTLDEMSGTMKYQRDAATDMPARLRGLPPSEQYDTHSSQISRILARTLGISPYKTDSIIKGMGANLGNDILKATDFAIPRINKMMGGPILGASTVPPPDKNIADYIFISRLMRRSTAGDYSKTAFWHDMSQDAGQLTSAANALHNKLYNEHASPDEVHRILTGMSPDQRVYALLSDYYRGKQDAQMHPMYRAMQVVSVVNSIRKAIDADVLYSDRSAKATDRSKQFDKAEKIDAGNSSVKRVIDETLEDIAMREARNAQIVLGKPGWATMVEMPTDKLWEELRAISPAVADEAHYRLTHGTHKVLSYDAVKHVWPEVKKRLLTSDYGTSLADLRGQAVGESYGGQP